LAIKKEIVNWYSNLHRNNILEENSTSSIPALTLNSSEAILETMKETMISLCTTMEDQIEAKKKLSNKIKMRTRLKPGNSFLMRNQSLVRFLIMALY